MGGYVHNFIPNGDLRLWDAGPVPRDMDAQVTNTVITRLQRSQIMDPSIYPWIETQNWADIRGRLDKFTYSGEDSLRATIAAAGAADAFRLMTETVAPVAHTGASTQHVPVDNLMHRFAFTFAARSDHDGNLIGVRLILRSAADNPIAYWSVAANQWLAANTRNDFGMTTMWRRYGVSTQATPTVFGGVAVENMVWQVSNGTAADQMIDLDDFVIEDLDDPIV